MRDETFIRGDVPMTKSEVRAISIDKLELSEDSVLYDIGAGTGSVSIEASLHCKWVYAIEKKEEAVCLLNKNRDRFKRENITIVKGQAPEIFSDLTTPSHAFVGGSSGNMREILKLLLRKNRDIRVVINVIALETLGQVLSLLEELHIDGEIVCVQIAKAERLQAYHLMKGQNPVYVISFGGREALSRYGAEVS